MTAKIRWWGSQGHFCCKCDFHLTTTIGNKFMISTVGDWVEKGKIMEIGIRRKYETMVFRLQKKPHDCGCPKIDPTELDTAGYNKCSDAIKGHMQMIADWENKR
jgi:hypothetical protein